MMKITTLPFAALTLWLVWFISTANLYATEIALVMVISGWLLAFGYRYTLSRSLAQDLTPVVVFPLIFLRLGRKWFANSKRTIVPVDWNDALASPSISRRLLPAKEIVLGHSKERVIFASLRDDKHLLVTGKTGEGKTSIALSAILGLLSQGPSVFNKMHFSIHDPKRVVGLHFQDLVALHPDKFQVHISLEASLEALNSLVARMNSRTERMGQARVFDTDQINLPHILVYIDEPQLFYTRSKEYEPLVLNLVTAGRQSGIHVILTTPYAHGKIISTAYRPNFKVVSGFLPEHTQRVVGMPVSDLDRFQFLYQKSERAAPIRFSSYAINPAHIQDTIQKFHLNLKTAEEIALYLFCTIPGCGMRTLLAQGHTYSPDPPYPFNEVSVNPLRYSSAAWTWAREFLAHLTELGIASKPGRGQARQPKVNFTEALNLYRSTTFTKGTGR